MDKQIAIQEIIGTTPACLCCIQARVESLRAEGWWRVSLRVLCSLWLRMEHLQQSHRGAGFLLSGRHIITHSYPDSCLQTMLTARTRGSTASHHKQTSLFLWFGDSCRKILSRGKGTHTEIRPVSALDVDFRWRPSCCLFLFTPMGRGNETLPLFPTQRAMYSFMICTLQNGKASMCQALWKGMVGHTWTNQRFSCLWLQNYRIDSNTSSTGKQQSSPEKQRRGKTGGEGGQLTATTTGHRPFIKSLT